MKRGESLIVLALLKFLLAAIGAAVEYDHEGQVIGRHMAPGWPARMFQPQTYRPETQQICQSYEPCGYYSFALLNGEIPFTWIQSWCNCSSTQECVYDRVDKRRRVYLEKCAPKEPIEVFSTTPAPSTTPTTTTMSPNLEPESSVTKKARRRRYRVTAWKRMPTSNPLASLENNKLTY